MSVKTLQVALVFATLGTSIMAAVQMQKDLNSTGVMHSDGYLLAVSSVSAAYLGLSFFFFSSGVRVAVEFMLSLAWLAGTILAAVDRGGLSCFSEAEAKQLRLTHGMNIRVMTLANCNLGYAAITLASLTFAAFCWGTYKTIGGNYTVHVVPKQKHEALPQEDVYEKC